MRKEWWILRTTSMNVKKPASNFMLPTGSCTTANLIHNFFLSQIDMSVLSVHFYFFLLLSCNANIVEKKVTEKQQTKRIRIAYRVLRISQSWLHQGRFTVAKKSIIHLNDSRISNSRNDRLLNYWCYFFFRLASLLHIPNQQVEGKMPALKITLKTEENL